MKLILILIAILMIFGVCGLSGGLVMLWAGHLLSRIDAFGVTPFQAAIICTIVVVGIIVVFRQSLFPSFLNPLSMDDFEEEEEEDDFPVRRVVRPKKRR